MTVQAPQVQDGAWADEAHARRRLLGGGVWGAADFALSILLGLPLTVVLVRVLPRHVYGSLATAMSVTLLLGSVVSIGLADSLARTLAWRGTSRTEGGLAGEDKDVVATAWRLALRASVVGGVLAVAIGLALRGSRVTGATSLVFIAIPLVMIAPFHNVLIGLVRVSYRPRASFAASVTTSALALTGTVAVLVLGARSGGPVIAVRTAAVLLGFGLLGFAIRGSVPVRGTPSREIGRAMVRIGAAVMLVSMAAIAISQLDVLTVGVFRGGVAAGVYAPLSRLLDIVTGAFAALGTYAIVALSSAGARSTTALARQYHWCTRWTLVALGPALAVLLVAPAPILHLLFGPEPASAPTVVRIIAGAACVHVLLGYNGLSLVALGESRLVLLQGGIGLAVSVVACLSLVPVFGIKGAAVASALALVASNLAGSLSLWQRHCIAPMDRRSAVTCGVFLVGTVGCGLTAWLAGTNLIVAGITVVVVAAVTFAAAIQQGGGWRGEEMVAMRSFAESFRHAEPQASADPLDMAG